jgi:hypothetical protein
VSATHDMLRRTAQQLIATSIALLHTLEALRREMEKRLDDSEARIVRTRQLLAGSTALLQQSESSGYHRLPAKPMLRNRDSNQPTTQTSTPLHFSHA